MTITRAEAESLLLRRCAGLMDLAGLDSENETGLNKDLHDPLVYALLSLGHSIADYALVSDTDMSAVTSTEMLSFLDLAEYRLLLNISENMSLVDVTLGPRKESYGQLGIRLKSRISDLSERIKVEHGIGVGNLEIGDLNLNFQTKGDDDLPYDS